MKESNSNNSLSRMRNLSKKTLGIITVLFIISSIFSLKAFNQPSQLQEKIQSNKITEKTNITYTTDALPDGLTSINGTIFSKVQKNLRININSVLTSQEPVAVQGEAIVNCILIADGMWQQIIPISSPMKVDISGKENTLVNGEFHINLDDINNRIDKAEEKIGANPSKYIIKIKPEFKASAVYNGSQVSVDNTAELNFEYSYGQIKLIDENKEFLKESPIEEIKMVNGEFNIFGITLPLMFFRFIFSGLALVLLALIIGNVKTLKFNLNKKSLSSSDIDKKYKGRLVTLKQSPEFQNKINLFVNNFKELVQIADDKELTILRYSDIKGDKVFYYTIDNDCVFTYSVEASGERIEVDINNASLGSDGING